MPIPKSLTASLAVLLSTANVASSTVWNLQDTIIGSDFYDAFAFMDITDPSGGYV